MPWVYKQAQTREAALQEAVKPGLPATAVQPEAADQDREVAREFGGTFGAAFIVTLSHALMLYLWFAWGFHDGAVFYPLGISGTGRFFTEVWEQIVTHATPRWSTSLRKKSWNLYGTSFFDKVHPSILVRSLLIAQSWRALVGRSRQDGIMKAI